MRRKSGPKRYEQWAEALSLPLSAQNAEYMLRGKCSKDIYPTLFNKLSDYITDAFNEASRALNNFNSNNTDLVFALKRLNAVYRLSLFFRDIEWIDDKDKTALNDSLKTAALATVQKLKPQADIDPNILFECTVLARTANGET